jgi:acetolactate synthase-1/2/3 large subunit
MPHTGAYILFDVLKHFSITDIVGYPGGCALPLYDELHRRKGEIKHYLSTHEQGAMHIAQGYARSSGKLGVALTTSGPGATNTVTGIADAKLDSTPILIITTNVASNLIGTDAFQEVDIISITKVITKKNYFVNKVSNIQGVLCEAITLARQGRHGPVLVDITKDALCLTCELLPF